MVYEKNDTGKGNAMNKKKPGSLKDNIYRMFLRYTVTPAFLIAIAGVIITFGVWELMEIDSTYSASEEISSEMELLIKGYEESLIKLSSDNKILKNPNDTEKRVSIFEDVYRLSNNFGYKTKIYMFDKNYVPVITSTEIIPDVLHGKSVGNWGIFKQMSENTEETAFDIVQDSENQYASLYIGRAMKDGPKITGYVVLSVDSTEFRVLLTKVPAQTIITDSNGWIFIADNYEFLDNLNRMSRDYENKKGYINCNGKIFYKVNSGIMNNQLRIYTVKDISNQLDVFKWVGLLLAMMFAAIVFSLIRGANRISVRSTKDIDVIEEAFVQVQKGNLNNYISINSSMEFENIGESYNLMLDSLKEQIEKNKEMIAHMAFAQIKQLESQINPHFLFNTLENIRVMCKIDSAKADKMIVNLSSLLRYSISNAEEDVTVRKDIDITEHYLSILKIRFNNRFKYKINIDEEIMDCIIPKLLIQPLIENAIKYGFGDKEVLTVEIKGFQEDDHLKFICMDDGTGIDDETLKELKHTLGQPKNRTSHLGLYNIHKRISLKYKGNFGLEIESKLNEGTTLILTLPMCKSGNDILEGE